ncbi:DUF4268 domain-containing protein [Shewanella sp. AS16]|uniref:DUF4268 domain-containing protein n=1 Tax=Shewanella sp. AS16 TaxID=2907625 RepID=UPI001F457C68|nr:DUF4268 domain-containing protein [Shewanella sp. AS16]MCE9684687.1 DUF4268 domain-containing protein [Shewanella sp. AS16]
MFGELSKVALREIWPREASDFTPWLAENIEELGKALGMELELIEQEASVGDFSLDILAKDLGSSKSVIVENQLTQTDHDHLGKLLTYAAGFDASIVIWISESIREEHRQAMDWLNQRTDNETLFFGVVVEVIRIDNSRPAFNFKLAASPNEWQKNKKRQTQRSSVSTKGEKYQNYFQSLIDTLRDAHRFTSAKAGQPQNWYSFPSGFSGLTYGANFAQGGKARAEFYIDLGDKDKNKYVFDQLHNQKEKIESELGEAISWERLDNKRASRLALYTDGVIDDSDAELERIKGWHIDKLLKLKSLLGMKIGQLAKSATSM